MAKIFSLKKLKRLQVLFNRRGIKGFTLLELLVSMIIAALITVLLLGLVVELTQVNQKDAARSQVQQDMQSAMDYIAQDLREAVFVYNGACLQGEPEPTSTGTASCTNLLNYLPSELTANRRVPVLAFWRTDPLPRPISGTTGLCSTNAASLSDKNNPMNTAKVPCVAGSSYSLVVYLVDPSRSDIWQGRARLARYKLGQFVDGATDERGQSQGYVNPSENKDGVELAFQRWPLNKDDSDRRNDSAEAVNPGSPTIAQNPIQVLVDFLDDQGGIIVDQTTNTYVGRVTPSCDGFGTDATEIANALSPLATANPNNVYSFYACVQGGGAGKNTEVGKNQDVQLTLIGNVAGLGGFAKSINTQEGQVGDNNKDRLSPLQTRVLVRGVTKKQGA